MAKLPSQRACNSDVTSYRAWANPNLFYFNTVTKKGVSQLLLHTSEVSSKMYLVLVGDQTDYLTGSGCGCKKFSLVSVIVIHNVIYITWCNYCRANKGTSTKGIIFVIYLYHCHILFYYFLSVQESSQPEEDFSFLPALKPCFSFIIPTLFWFLCEGRTEPGLILSLIRVLKHCSCGLQQAVYYQGMSFCL